MTHEKEPMVWRRQPRDKHLWAFYYFCKRMGDKIAVNRRPDGKVDLYVWRKLS